MLPRRWPIAASNCARRSRRSSTSSSARPAATPSAAPPPPRRRRLREDGRDVEVEGCGTWPGWPLAHAAHAVLAVVGSVISGVGAHAPGAALVLIAALLTFSTAPAQPSRRVACWADERPRTSCPPRMTTSRARSCSWPTTTPGRKARSSAAASRSGGPRSGASSGARSAASSRSSGAAAGAASAASAGSSGWRTCS